MTVHHAPHGPHMQAHIHRAIAPPTHPPGMGWSRPGQPAPPAGGLSVADLDPVIVEHWRQHHRLFPSDVHQIFEQRDRDDADPVATYISRLRAVTT